MGRTHVHAILIQAPLNKTIHVFFLQETEVNFAKSSLFFVVWRLHPQIVLNFLFLWVV